MSLVDDVNYRLFTHSDVSYRYNRENNDVMLELLLSSANVYGTSIMIVNNWPVACIIKSPAL